MSDTWPGGFVSGDRVSGIYGNGVVATHAYCMGRSPEQYGKEIRGAGIQRGLVPVIFDDVGCFWMAPAQIKRSE